MTIRLDLSVALLKATTRARANRFKYAQHYMRALKIQKNCLDVGAGDHPFPDSSVLCDLSKERGIKGHKALKGTAFVLCDIHSLPFRDKAFPFVNCSQALEHADDPQQALSELKRVAEHGHIETPHWFTEKILYGCPQHKWIIRKKRGKLFYQKIVRAIVRRSFFELYNRLALNPVMNFLLWNVINILDDLFHIINTRYTF